MDLGAGGVSGGGGETVRTAGAVRWKGTGTVGGAATGLGGAAGPAGGSTASHASATGGN